ncbi:MAG: hypothetical protein ACEPOV_05155 [Hyphomicrobiales bacterium]
MKTSNELSKRLLLNMEMISSFNNCNKTEAKTAGYTVCTMCCGDNSLSCGPTEL